MLITNETEEMYKLSNKRIVTKYVDEKGDTSQNKKDFKKEITKRMIFVY